MANNKTVKDVFKEFYPKLLEVLPVDCLINQFYSKKLLSSTNKSNLKAFSTDKEKTRYFLDEVIEPGLKIDYMDQLNEMLAIMVNSDDPPVKFLANEIMKSCDVVPPSSSPSQIHGPSITPMVKSQDTEAQEKSKALVKFSKKWTIDEAYRRLTLSIEEEILASSNLPRLQRACIREIKTLGSNLPIKLIPQIEITSSVNGLLETLTKSEYWNWFDTRLLTAVTEASGSQNAIKSLQRYKATYYNKKISDLILCEYKITPFKNFIPIVEKYKKDPSKLTILDLQKHQYEIENILEGGLVLVEIKTGCVELTWQLPQELVYQAYTSMKRKHDELSSLAVKSLVCEEADEIAGLPILWRGQEVGEVGPIEPLPEHVRQEPYSLPQGFQWVTLSDSDAKEVESFAGKYTKDKNKTINYDFITTYPNTRSEWQFGIRASNSKLVGVVLAYPVCISIGGVSITCCLPYITYHPKYYGRRIRYMLNKELMRRVNLYNINHLFIMFQNSIVKPITTVHFWRYILASSQLPSSPRTPGWRRMTSEDVPSALALINKWSSQFEIRQVFNSEDEFAHHLLCPPTNNMVVNNYVVENDSNSITDLVAFRFYHLYNMVAMTTLVSTQTSVKCLITDALVCAKQIGTKELVIPQFADIKSDVLLSLSFQHLDDSYVSVYNYKYDVVAETNFWYAIY